MPRIDPLQLLTCLNILLAKNGGVLSHAEVERLAKLMGRYSKKLVSKCIYIQILKCTKTDLLGEFMRVGGWALTHTWLTDGIRGKNWPLVQEILELLLLCPVDVQRLKSNSAPKLVKQLSKDGGNEGVRIYATRLVEQWLNVVKSETKMTTNEDTNIINSIAMTSPTNTSTLICQDTKTIDSEDILHNSPNNNSSSSPSSAAQIVKNLLSPPTTTDQQPQRKSSTDSGIMYKIIVKDGKQILSKIENSPNSTKGETPVSSSSVEMTTTASSSSTTTDKNDFIDSSSNIKNENEIIDLKSEDIISNKENDKKNNVDKDLKQKSKNSSSSSSKDKHKSSSSSHRSSSKSSSSKSSSSSSSKSKSSSSNHRNSTDSSKSRDSGKDKERSDKHKSSSSSSSSKSSSSNKDKHRDKSINIKDKDKEKADQAEKDKETLSKIIPPTLDKLGKIPKKINKDDTTTNNTNNKQITNQSITIPSKKASMSIEIRKDTDKAKTVKTYKSQFRSHGLTEEAPPPPSRKNLKKPSSLSLPGTSIPNTTTLSSTIIMSNNSLSLKRSSPPPTSSQPTTNSTEQPLSPKDLMLPSSDKKPKIDLTSLSPTNIIEKPGAIKLIAAKPKPASLVESDMFMDALFASALPKKDARKRKRRTSGSKEPSSPSDSPVTVKAAPLKFYQDTLEEKDDNNKNDNNGSIDKDIKDKEINKNDSGNGVDDEDDDIPLKKVKEDIEEKCRLQEKDDSNATTNQDSEDDDQEIYEEIKKPPGPGCGPDGPPGVLMLHRRRGPKKKLKWRPQEQLEEIRFFELDETERVNVTKTFTDMKQMERCNERETFLMNRKVSNEDIMVEQTQWMPLILCDDVPTHPDGSQSKEKKIQLEREQTTLKALYFSRAMIPDSASEPDMEHYQITEASVIPLDDITGNPDAVNDYMKYGWPEPKGSPPRNLDDNSNLGNSRGGAIINDNDMKFPNNQFNPFLPFGSNNNNNGINQQNGPWSMGVNGPNIGPPIQNGVPSILSQNLMAGPINPFQMPGNVIPPNIMMNINGVGSQMSPPDIPNNLIQPFGQVGPNFIGPPNGMMNGQIGPLVVPLMGNNNNFGGPPMNMNGGIPNMNNGPMRGGMNNRNNINGGGGNWRSGSQSNNSGNNNNNGGGGGGNNWRGGGSGGGGGNQRNWVHNNNRGICKSFMRGFCRNGNKCNYIHPGPNNNNNRI